MGHCDQCPSVPHLCHENVWLVPKIPNSWCLILSVSISLNPMERKKIKKWYFSIKVWSFDQAYKKCQNRDFSIFDLIFENLPINLDGAMIPQKKWQTFLYQNIPQPAQLAHPRVSNSPRKVYPMWRDSRYFLQSRVTRVKVNPSLLN